MARVSGITGGSDLVVYPSEHMRQVATKIIAQAGDQQSQLDAAWNDIQRWIDETVDRRWQHKMFDVLTPYVQRLRASFDWHGDLARQIFDMVDAIEGTEANITRSFSRSGHGPQPS